MGNNITTRTPRAGAGRTVALLAAALAVALVGVAAAQTLTVDGATGSLTLSPLLHAGVWLGPDGPMVRREVRLARVAWNVPKDRIPSVPVVPGITLRVREHLESEPCLRYILPRDLPPSVYLPTAALVGSTSLDFSRPVFRPGRTYYVRGCVFGLPYSAGGGEAGVKTNVVAVRIDWDGVAFRDRVNLDVDSGSSRLEPVPDGSRVVSQVRATLHVRSQGRILDSLRDTLTDRFVVDVYVDGEPEPVHRAVVPGVARSLAAGVPEGLPVTVVHPVPPTAETHLVQYVINADGGIPEQNYEDNHVSMSFGYRVHSAGVSFAPNWLTEGRFRVGVEEIGGSDDHLWVDAVYAGGPLLEGDLCPTPSCEDPATTNRAVDPTPSLRVWVDSPHVPCVGTGGFVEPTYARSRTGGAAATPLPRKSFFCYAHLLAHVPFETTTVTVEARIHGVSTRWSQPLRKVWRAVVPDPDARLPDLTGQVGQIDFLDGKPLNSSSGRACGAHPRVRFVVRNEGRQPSGRPVAARVWISPPEDPSLARLCRSAAEQFQVIPDLAPGATYEFVRDFGSDTPVAPRATVHIDVDSGLVLVEPTKTNNRAVQGVPSCTHPDTCR